ncbi:MAG: glycosyltransferase family 2 protein [Thermoplasmatales archaeon]|jgi:glycosyltransferase involved in cell wall biosynthesis
MKHGCILQKIYLIVGNLQLTIFKAEISDYVEFNLTIFIPTYNRPALLETCISSIKRSLESTEISYEILVVNEAPIDVNLHYDNITILNYGKEIMPCNAMYFALLNAKGKYFLRIDDDNEIDADLIPSLYNYITNHRDIAYCGALGKREDGSISNPGTVFSKNFKISLRKRNISNKDYDVDLVDNVYIMNPALIELDKFYLSCRFFPWSFEDGYDQLRLKKLNFRVVVLPYAETTHHTHRGEVNLKQAYHYGRSKFLMYRCIFKFSFVKSITLSTAGLLVLPYIYRTDRANLRSLFLACRYYLNGIKDAFGFIKNNQCLE